MKPGFKTTEFWISLLAVLVGAVLASGLLDSTTTNVDNQIVGLIATVLGALGYTVSRAFVKSGDAKAAAVKAVAEKPVDPSQP